MPTNVNSPRANQVCRRLRVTVVLAAWIVGVSAQAGLALNALTVPATSLPNSCHLRPYVPAMSPVAQVGTTTTWRPNPRSSAPFPGNPWVGTDRELLIYLRGTPPVPDAPPPSAAELSAMKGRWAQHVVEGYRALYDSTDGGVEVQAIRFDDATLATTSAPSVVQLLNTPRGASDRIVLGAVVVQVTAASATPCYKAVGDHIRSLK